MGKTLLLDSTLREGEQAPLVHFSESEALQLASQIDQSGVDFIEVSPIVGHKQREIARRLMAEKPRATVVLHCRAKKEDIESLLDLDASFIAMYLSTSDMHLANKLHLSRGQALEHGVEMVEFAKAHGLKLRFTCEDASRTELDYLLEMVRRTTAAGADRISITDTVGIMTPAAMFAVVKEVRAATDAGIDVHCHNDLGLALANALAGVEAGADCIHASVNGAGERAGIPKVAEVAMALQVLYGQRKDIKVEKLVELSASFSKHSGLPTDPFSPVVGENVFRHKGGTHLAAVLKEGASYEAFSPESIGRRRRLVVGGYSGKNILRYLSETLGMKMSDPQLEKALARLKEKERDLFDFAI
ncbi:TPA: 2-isopropylmalate synthase [Candidatus Micrarchaeota archaeon]|nr:2-isopropylmalate synthase [Candidatus Micrarchaeota archaeon]